MTKEALASPKDAALKPALEALEEQIRMANGWQSPAEAKAITAIKAALAQEQEPVAWRTFDGEGGYDYRSYEDNESYADEWDKRNPNHKGWVDKLYTTPPQRPWVGLTDDEAQQAFKRHNCDISKDLAGILARDIEAKLKEKNT